MPNNAGTAAARLTVAPMMDWTDRHCRYLHRLMSRHALLYTEMVTAAALVHGPSERLLEYNAAEHPVALQIGGSEPDLLAKTVRIAAPFGYDEINLNVGCPSDRVQSGCFGAVLMERPELVRDCVIAMQAETDVPVTVKCRIGVDDQIPAEVLPRFIETVAAGGVRHFVIHARKAWLKGLSPKENRDIPPLDYPLVMAMKAQFPELVIGINGGISTLAEAQGFLGQGIDTVMIGRAAYHDPATVLCHADPVIFGIGQASDPSEVVRAMLPYAEAHLSAGGRLNAITRHMMGLFNGRPGARMWRRALSEGAHKPGANSRLIEDALAHIAPIAA